MTTGRQGSAVLSAIRILERLAEAQGPGCTLAEITAATATSREQVEEVLDTLEREAFVQRDPLTRQYVLGPALIPLGTRAAEQSRLVETAFRHVEELARGSRLSFAIAQRTPDGEAQVIEPFYPYRGPHVAPPLGSRFGLFDGALGKCLLAALPANEAERAVRERGVPTYTEQTITDPDALLREIEAVRERGWAASVKELIEDHHGVAAPVPGPSGDLGLFIFAGGYAGDLPAERLPSLGAELAQVARTIATEARSEAGADRDRERVPEPYGG